MAKRHRSRGSHNRRDRADLAVFFGARFLRLLGSELSRELADRVDAGDYHSLLERKLDIRGGLLPVDFAVEYQALSLFKKFPFEGYVGKDDRVRTALSKFKDSEDRCSWVGSHLRRADQVTFNGFSGASVLHTARRKISALLGDFDLDSCLPYMAFGPGASTGHKRSCGDPYYKFRDLPEVTPFCEPLVLAAICSAPIWREALEVAAGGPIGLGVLPKVAGNRITTVPKDAKTERTIAIEPEGNMYIQKGIGGFIRRCLRKVGIDLNSQLANQQAAKIGSSDGSLATIDLASASDSISMALVTELLPPTWTAAIERCRSPVGVLPSGERVLYRKVSSMGNGFTFELESLIFWALCSAVCDLTPTAHGSRVLVYGDDIVVPSHVAEDVIRVLEMCGFTTNRDKTFLDGPFRESCGKHYYSGHDVTPIYLRKEVNTRERFCWMHNSILQWYHRVRPIFWLTSDEYELVLSLRQAVNPAERTFIPFAERDSVSFLGDIGLIANFSEALPRRCSLTGSYVAVGLAEYTCTQEFDDVAFLTRQLSHLNQRSLCGGDPAASRQWEADSSPPSRVNSLRRGMRRIRVVVHQWSDSYLVV